MKILLTGVTGYIGKRLLPVLIRQGHEVTCIVRDPRRFDSTIYGKELLKQITVVKANLLHKDSLEKLSKDFDAAYYLVHSMTTYLGDFQYLESKSAQNFSDFIQTTTCKQIIYLSGISNDRNLSPHLSSRKNVETILQQSSVPVTVLRAAIIIGSGSASFEMIRDLVEKLPLMVAPKWVTTKCQPIAIRNVIQYLEGVLLKEEAFHRTFDIGGPDILTYKDMLLQYAETRGLQREIITVPFFSPRLSSYWLLFVTSTSYALARNLVDSLHNEVVCRLTGIEKIVPLDLIPYQDALELAFQRIEQNEVVSSWKESLTGSVEQNFMDFIQVPKYGCFTDKRSFEFTRDTEEVLENIWSIGGDRGWYYGNWLWAIRGLMDTMVGGVGLRRGRRDTQDLRAGEALDFWRVLLADKENKRLLLFAEMKLPGEAWLEFKIQESPYRKVLFQKATFRPLGIWGRVYWYLVYPFHNFIFPGMAKELLNHYAPHQRRPLTEGVLSFSDK